MLEFTNVPIRLVYHCYVTNNIHNSYLWKLHIACLKKYFYIFSDIVFVISLDDINDIDLISKIEIEICSLHPTGNIKFKIIQNDSLLREAVTFKEEIFDKLNDLEGITFFSHLKGSSNPQVESLYKWITAMYYFNLNSIKKVCDALISAPIQKIYGALPVKALNLDDSWAYCKYRWVFAGTMYWINTRRIYQCIQNNEDKLKLFKNVSFDNRYAAEHFPGNIFDLTLLDIGYCTKYYLEDSFLWTNNAGEYLKSICDDNQYKEYEKFYNNIIEEINE